MRWILISADNTRWQNVFGVLAAVILVPVTMIVTLVMRPFVRPIVRTSEEVAAYLRDFIEGVSGDGDWDDFVSIPIADEQLESIRMRASHFPSPRMGLSELEALLLEAEALASSN